MRKNHPVISEVQTVRGIRRYATWYNIYDAPPEKMHASLQLRRKGILWDAKQLKLDFDSYNDNNIHQAKLKEIEWDLKKDLLELEQPTTYPEDAPDNPDDPDGGSEEDLIL